LSNEPADKDAFNVPCAGTPLELTAAQGGLDGVLVQSAGTKR
jgi:hypothetical protein